MNIIKTPFVSLVLLHVNDFFKPCLTCHGGYGNIGGLQLTVRGGAVAARRAQPQDNINK